MRMTLPLASGFCYKIGQSLYIPLTSRSNAVTLPATRGPRFQLQPSVVASLCRVRDAEYGQQKWKDWCTWLDGSIEPQSLPVALPLVTRLDNDASLASYRPTIAELLQEVHSYLQTLPEHKMLVIAGEGEPTLRWNALLELVRGLRNMDTQPLDGSDIHRISLRMTTNGLVSCVNSCRQPCQELKAAGLDGVSVALMTHDAPQYDALMTPKLVEREAEQAHGIVCDFIRSAASSGLLVEATGVDRPDVNKAQTETLATELGVTLPFRWRPYFPD